MAIVRRSEEKDAIWSRAWTVDTIAELSSIPMPKRMDIAQVVEDNKVRLYSGDNWINLEAGGGGGGAPTNATYITQTLNADLTAEQALSELGTGIVKNTTGTGILSIASAPTDYIANSDSRLSDARTPLGHNTSHVTGGSDVIANVVAGGNSGLITGSDKTKLDGIASGAEVNVNADWNAVSGDAEILNKPSIPSQYTDEMAQDAVGVMADSQSLVYTDATPLLEVKIQQSIIKDASGLKLSGDTTSPGNSMLYGTNSSGTKGWYTQPGGGGASPILANANTVNETANAADTYFASTKLDIGGRIKAGSILRWKFSFTKTAAGVATPIWRIRFGTNGTIADAVQNTFTGPVQTAAVDTGYVEIEAVIRAVTASGTVQGVLTQEHMNTTTGIQNVAQIRILQSLSAAFDLTPAGLKVGVSVNPGAAGVWTFQLVTAEALNLN